MQSVFNAHTAGQLVKPVYTGASIGHQSTVRLVQVPDFATEFSGFTRRFTHTAVSQSALFAKAASISDNYKRGILAISPHVRGLSGIFLKLDMRNYFVAIV